MIYFLASILSLGLNSVVYASEAEAMKSGDFRLCINVAVEKCFQLSGRTYTADGTKMELPATRRSEIATRLKDFLRSTSYASPPKNLSAASCEVGLFYKDQTTSAQRCTENLKPSDKSRVRRLIELLADPTAKKEGPNDP